MAAAKLVARGKMGQCARRGGASAREIPLFEPGLISRGQ